GKLEDIAERLGPERLIVAPSCSLVYVPVDVELEDRMDPDIRQWLAFAKQKVEEVSVLTDALCCGRNEVEHIFESNTRAMEWRSRVRDASANPSHTKIDQITERMCHRQSPYHARRKAQETLFNLPLFPTTTIGSFPQTKEIRDARKKMRSGELSSAEYKNAMQHEITNNIELQEKIGLDVLVHGEPERTDMVEYFADQLDGMLVTQHGWVQSYGSRCVKPPIIHGDISRPKPITVEWATFAQAQTGNPVKGMLTGPVTILQWSFERDDKPPEISSLQLALAIRDEVADLEAAGIKIIQIDEPAIREGLPLRHDDRQEYLRWAIRAFKIASSGVDDDTQIHTHMCYSEFGDMLQSIIDMDADVISIEAARSHMELLTTLRSVGYPNEIGPGVWDVHSPRVPTEEEIEALLKKALEAIPPDRLWVNPDCGLKTRGWKEVVPALNALVQAASSLRHKTKSGLPTASRARE
ncbi:MAG TPA: 5-methyltetrahydropteroyltriglutamate--homocysteine S-methyltransferase, partial [Candidatus Obscuribacterales bacterium]